MTTQVQVTKRIMHASQPPAPPTSSSSTSSGPRWSFEEERLLQEAVLRFGTTDWATVAAHLQGCSFSKTQRTASMCEQRWKQVISSGVKRGHWTAEEDTVIVQAVDEQLAALKVDPAQRTTPIISIDIKWSEVSKELSGLRTAKQCRERYSNHLDPTLKKTAWSADEDVQLMKAQASLGNSWTKISQQMPGRSENEVKNRWYSVILRRYSDDLPFYQQQERDESSAPREEEEPRLDGHCMLENVTERKPPHSASKSRKRKNDASPPSPNSSVVPGVTSTEPSASSRYSLREKKKKSFVEEEDSDSEADTAVMMEGKRAVNPNSQFRERKSSQSLRSTLRDIDQFLQDSRELLSAVECNSFRSIPSTNSLKPIVLSSQDVAFIRLSEWYLFQHSGSHAHNAAPAEDAWDHSLCTSSLTTASDFTSSADWRTQRFAHTPVSSSIVTGGVLIFPHTSATTNCNSPATNGDEDDELSIAAFLYSRFLGSNRTSAVCSTTTSSVDLPALARSFEQLERERERERERDGLDQLPTNALFNGDLSQSSTPAWSALQSLCDVPDDAPTMDI